VQLSSGPGAVLEGRPAIPAETSAGSAGIAGDRSLPDDRRSSALSHERAAEPQPALLLFLQEKYRRVCSCRVARGRCAKHIGGT
jgi:hypothetical protein